ncbi:MAG: GNAT family N-acetyltransferase [Planctomycetota bacterium]
MSEGPETAGRGAGVRVRPAYPRDLTTLVEFNRAMAHETEDRALDPAVVTAGVQSVLDDPGRGSYFVAERDGRVVGGLLLTFEWSDWRNGVFWWIQSVYVRPGDRGGGVFRALYDHVRTKARVTPGACGLRLYVERGNAHARRVYAAVGMVESAYRLYEVDFVLGSAGGLG